MKRIATYITVLAVLFAGLGFTGTADAAVYKYGIYMVGAKAKTVYAGDDLELKVTKGSALREDQIKWTISNTSVLKFEDGERYGDDVEVIGLKKGSAKVTVQNLKTGAKGSYTVTVKQANKYGIKMVGSKTRTVEAGDDVELRVSKGSALANSQIKWTISNTSILRFEDGINKGQNIEVEGIRKGTAKVTVQNLKTGAKGSYTIKVVPDYD